MLSVGMKWIKITMTYTCGTHTRSHMSKKKKTFFSRTAFESHTLHCVLWKCRKKAEIYPLAPAYTYETYAESAGSRRYETPRRHFVPYMLSMLHVDYARAHVLTRHNRILPRCATYFARSWDQASSRCRHSTVYCFLTKLHATIYYIRDA